MSDYTEYRCKGCGFSSGKEDEAAKHNNPTTGHTVEFKSPLDGKWYTAFDNR